LDFMYRIEDSFLILNRIISRHDNFINGPIQHERDCQIREAKIRLEVIENTFSFITFLFLLLGFYQGLNSEIEKRFRSLRGNLKNLRNFPKETGPILDLSRLLKKQKK